MKRVWKILSAALIVAMTLLLGVGCSGNVNAPGKAWAQSETLEYAVTRGETSVGVMTVLTERVSGEAFLADHPERIHNLGNGTRVTSTVRDLEGNLLMKSESLLNEFEGVASARTTYTEGKESRYHVYFDGKYGYCSIDGGDYERTRIRTTHVTNELIYTLLRCYDLTSYSTSYTILSPVNGEKISLSVASASSDEKFSFTAVNVDGEKSAEAKSYAVRISLSESPVGSPILVWYASSDYQLIGSASSRGLPSSKFPLKIVENDLVYTLTKITAN